MYSVRIYLKNKCYSHRMKTAYLITLLFTVFAITAIVIADDVIAEPEQDTLDLADMTLSELFDYYKPLYFPVLCLSVSVFFFYKTIRYSFFKDTEDEKKS